ncbi:hypothetical protein [Neobacillus niacini]|uniref:hypothetical protein n=1 Tax=Neobacillus niacini TaxID=86668 RepID=UPI001C8D807F|nr:hypothetical protein [Neobacillus niacini]MBY0145114.1 hypothetical protein [Neobacillus niacini]
MSDFIYSKKKIEKGKLTIELQSIYREEKPIVQEFHGDWGSLAVSNSPYNGFNPFEIDEHICVVLGGPLLDYQENQFLNLTSGSSGTEAIFNRYIKGIIKWDEDLSGPFAIILVNKNTSEVECITDLMSFIPIYTYSDSNNIILSSHVDVVARISGQKQNIDIVSAVDFILHGIVTYPYTSYNQIRQIAPASTHIIKANEIKILTKNYWLPKEKYKYNNIDQAANDLRNSLQKYVDSIAGNMYNIAQFISGGEDSRTLSGLLPKQCNQDAFIFLDHMNREGKVAEKAANSYGAKFKIGTRSKLHYLEILSSCVNLVGAGSQYIHAHTFGFHKSCKLNEYSAVFGGLFSDALLKGARIKKLSSLDRFPFLPQIKRLNYSSATPLKNDYFQTEVLEELTKRRQAHLKYVKSIRKESAEEWFELWPSSMNVNIPNIHVNRRLFRSYEPFMSKDVVKMSATVPQDWKLNRKLFQKAAKPLLKPTKWLLHGDGRLPYFSWYINIFIQFVIWFFRTIGSKIGLIKGNQGPWGEWKVVMNSTEWKHAIDNYRDGINLISSALKERDVKELFEGNKLNQNQKINLLQTLYINQNILK